MTSDASTGTKAVGFRSAAPATFLSLTHVVGRIEWGSHVFGKGRQEVEKHCAGRDRVVKGRGLLTHTWKGGPSCA